jgi:uncharacterized membrane protein YecN with MAPEG domain
MHPPIITTAAAGFLGLIFLALSAHVVMGRTTGKVMLGSGEGSDSEASPLFVAIRSHANFAEYVPFCLLLIAGLEIRSGATVLVKVLAAVLVLARVAHPIGMMRKSPNPFRAGGFVGTMLVLVVASLVALAGIF